ncbi:hypothetical protein LOC67_03370 [Stieleria sp. JC731]|uniref:hypothetical protein n=1 Tax=Pirellulaceae TaxID=2691357 RepID=UPI001E3C1AFE|nr:hypothetical protein [Stieleria sp. JC731]MCC9599588.1 hypothetical protein [Stieleria sp. JC731]
MSEAVLDTARRYAALHDRITKIRSEDQHWESRLNSIADSVPDATLRHRLQQMATAVANDTDAPSLVREYPNLHWLLTLRSDTGSADVTSILAEQAAYQSAVSQQRLRFLAYPIAISTVAALLGILICFFVVPPFADMFREFGILVPAPTRLLISISEVVTSHVIVPITLGAIAIAGFISVIAMIKRGVLFHDWSNRHSWISSPPKQHLAKLSIQLAEMIEEGLPTSHALFIAGVCVNHTQLFFGITELAQRYSEHERTGRSVRSTEIISIPANLALAIELASTQSPPDGIPDSRQDTTMLRALAQNYQELAFNQSSLLSMFIGMLTIVGVAMLVGFVVVALLSPLLSLVTSLSS